MSSRSSGHEAPRRGLSALHSPLQRMPISIIVSTTGSSSSPDAVASVWAAKKLISARSLPARLSASKKFTTISGWLALWIMIWDTSIWRLVCWNRWKIPSAQKCYLCSRYILLPMSPGWTEKEWRRGWDSNPDALLPFRKIQILNCQLCQDCHPCRRPLHAIARQRPPALFHPLIRAGRQAGEIPEVFPLAATLTTA
jgi:hypothetical protein